MSGAKGKLTHPCDWCPDSRDDNDIISGIDQQSSPTKGRDGRSDISDSG
jgi:hypothetical protein